MNWEWFRSEFLEEGELPPGRNNNPSAWSQRAPRRAPGRQAHAARLRRSQ